MTHSRRLRAACAAVAITALGATAMVSPAHAAEVPDIDPSAKGNIWVYTFEKPQDALTPGDGLPVDDADFDGLARAEVRYAAHKINSVDLTTLAGWDKLQEKAGDIEWAVGAAETNPRGLTIKGTGGSHSLVEVGAYVMKPNAWASDYLGAEPFVVTIPFKHPVTEEWTYDLYAYPKLEPIGTFHDKTVTDAGQPGNETGNGPLVTSTVDLKNPAFAQATRFDIYENTLKDATAHLVANPDSYALTVTIDGVTETIPAEWYAVSASTATSALFMFSNEGREALQAKVADAGAAVLQFSYVIDRFAVPYVSSSGVLTPKTTVALRIDGKTVENIRSVNYRYGDVTVTTKDADDDALLPDATYSVYYTETDALARTNPIVVTADGGTTVTSDATGKVTIPRLARSNWVNGAAAPADAPRTYWLVQNAPPTGYQALEAPTVLEIKTSKLAVTVVNAKATAPVPAFPLPLTGGTGTAAFAAAGLAILALALAGRRRALRADPATVSGS